MAARGVALTVASVQEPKESISENLRAFTLSYLRSRSYSEASGGVECSSLNTNVYRSGARRKRVGQVRGGGRVNFAPRFRLLKNQITVYVLLSGWGKASISNIFL